MQNFIRKALIATGVATASMVVATTAAFAQSAPVTEDIIFSGTVDNSCTFANPVEGTLEVDFATDPTLLSSEVGTATPGTVELTCTGNSTLEVAEPVADGANPGLVSPVATATASLFDANAAEVNVDSGVLPVLVTGPIADETVTVNMSVTDTGTIPPGDYIYTVTLTAAPL